MTIDELLNDYDWACVFGEDCTYNCDADVESYDGTATGRFTRKDVADIIVTNNGENEERSWCGIFKLKDGRYLAATGSCDYSGWDCQSGNNLTVGATLDSVVQFGLTDSERVRLGFGIANRSE